jgi:hypothetical protein
MSEENVEIVKHNVGAWNRDDWDAWIRFIDPELEWSTAVERVLEGTEHVWRGHSGAREAWGHTAAKHSNDWTCALTTFGTSATLFCSSGRSKPWGERVSSRWRANSHNW